MKHTKNSVKGGLYSGLLLCTLLLAQLLAVSCSKDDDGGEAVRLEVSPENIYLDASGVAILNISSNTTWNVSTAVSWLALSTLSGVGNGQVTLTASGAPADRSAIITVKAEGVTRQVAVTQSVSGTPTTPTDTTTPTNPSTTKGTLTNPYKASEAQKIAAALKIGEKTDYCYVKGVIKQINGVSSLFGWGAFYIADTLSDTSTSLCAVNCYYLQKKNFSSEDQIAVGDQVIIYGKLTYNELSWGNRAEIDDSYIYSLNGVTTSSTASAVTVSPTSITMESGKGQADFAIYSNSSWTVTSNQSWCYTLTTSGEGNRYIITVYVEPTNSTTDRTATITVKSGTDTATLTVTQKGTAKEMTGTHEGHDWVDLGLPSGVLWATTNVGANKPGDYGNYYAWGETYTKRDYSYDTYKYSTSKGTVLTKYCTSSANGNVDNKTTLEASDDAASVNWGGSWRMPTYEELKELANTSYCTWTWELQDGHYGSRVTGPNGNSIFLPAAGWFAVISTINVGEQGYYWTSSLNPENDKSYDLWMIKVGDKGGAAFHTAGIRYAGYSVRAVYSR